jgi:hypothetical protein
MAKRRLGSQIVNFLTCKWHATYHWKALNKGYNFASDIILIRSLHVKLWALRVAGVLIVRISFGNLETKYHLDAGFVVSHRIYYKGQVSAFLKSEPWWVLWVRICRWLVLAPKAVQLCTNQLVVCFCASSCEWVIKLLVILHSPISELQHALLPPKCYERGSMPRILVVPLFSFQTHIWFYQGAWGMHHLWLVFICWQLSKKYPSYNFHHWSTYPIAQFVTWCKWW